MNGATAARPAFLPPPPTVIRREGRPTFTSTPPASVITTNPERPTLRLPAVPPPADHDVKSTADSGAVKPATDVPTQPMIMQQEHPAQVIDANEPTLEEKPVRVEDMSEDQDAHTPVLRGHMMRARKKGAPAPHRATPVHRMPEIDPAAWLADEAHARTSDRRDSADGVDDSDTIVAAPRPTHYV